MDSIDRALREARTVLVVDGSPERLSRIQDLLTSSGRDVQEGCTAMSALALACVPAGAAWRPDLVLAEVSVPTLLGVELLMRMQHAGHLGEIPVRLYAAEPLPRDLADPIRDAFGAPAARALQRAVSFQQLTARLEALARLRDPAGPPAAPAEPPRPGRAAPACPAAAPGKSRRS